MVQSIICLLYAPDTDCEHSYPISVTDEAGLETLITLGVKYRKDFLNTKYDIRYLMAYGLPEDYKPVDLFFKGAVHGGEPARLIYLDSQKDMDILDELLALDCLGKL